MNTPTPTAEHVTQLDKSSAEVMAWVNMLGALAAMYSKEEVEFMLPLIAGHAVACSEEVQSRDTRYAAKEAEAAKLRRALEVYGNEKNWSDYDIWDIPIVFRPAAEAGHSGFALAQQALTDTPEQTPISGEQTNG
jgi:hypothetical protein